MSVRTRKNAIVLAAGAILALTMRLTSVTPHLRTPFCPRRPTFEARLIMPLRRSSRSLRGPEN